MQPAKLKVKRGDVLKAKNQFDQNSVYYKKGSKWTVIKGGSNVELELIRTPNQIEKNHYLGETKIYLKGDLSDLFEIDNKNRKTEYALEVINTASNKIITHIDTLTNLVNSFSEILLSGESYSDGNRIVQKPSSISSLIHHLNKVEQLNQAPNDPVIIYRLGDIKKMKPIGVLSIEQAECATFTKTVPDIDAETLWGDFANVCIDDDENLESDFHIFPKGLNRDVVWQWFDIQHSKGLAYLMGQIK